MFIKARPAGCVLFCVGNHKAERESFFICAVRPLAGAFWTEKHGEEQIKAVYIYPIVFSAVFLFCRKSKRKNLYKSCCLSCRFQPGALPDDGEISGFLEWVQLFGDYDIGVLFCRGTRERQIKTVVSVPHFLWQGILAKIKG